MQLAEDLDLPFLPMEEPAFAADPVSRFAEARKRHSWLARWSLGYVVTEYAAMRELFRMEDKLNNLFPTMVELMGAEGTSWGGFQKRHMLAQEGATHDRLRRVLAYAFAPPQIDSYRALMRSVITKLLDEWTPKRAFDFEDFAANFPIRVMCGLIGASEDIVPELRSSMEAMGMSTSMQRSQLPALEQGFRVLDDFVHDFAAERRRDPHPAESPDLLDLLLRAQDDGGLSDREVADILVFLFVAGYDTSKNVLTLTMYELLQRPDIYARCAEDIEYCKSVIEESLRFHGVVNSQRIAIEDFVYRDVLFPAGAVIWFPFTMATRDPSAVEDPDSFRPERRSANPHMGFGLGPHICLGRHLARAQMAEGLHLIAQRIPHPRSPGPKGWRPFPGVWGIQGLPIEFEPAA